MAEPTARFGEPHLIRPRLGYPTGHLVLHEKKKRREVTGRHDNLAEGVPAAEGWRYVQAADPAAVEALEDTLKRALKPEGSVHGSAAD